MQTALLPPPSTLVNPVADIEAQLPAPAVVDFSDIYTLIATTESLAAQGDSFTQLIQSIEISTRELLTLGAIPQDNVPQLQQNLRALLELIAPNIAEYTGKGLAGNAFDIRANVFLNHFENNREDGFASCALKFFVGLWLIGSLMTAGTYFGFGCIDFERSKHSYDDYFDDSDGKHNYHTDAENEKKRHNAIIEMSVTGPYLFVYFSVAICFYIKSGRISEDRVKTLCSNVRNAIGNIYSNYCTSRQTLANFQDNTSEQPKYFYELAAKLFAKMLVIDPADGYGRDSEKVIATLREFSNATTVEGRKFNHMLNESSSDSMSVCINRLLDVQVFRTTAGDWLTLRADHIFGVNGAQYMRDCIDQLREQMGLKVWRWSNLSAALDNTNPTIVAAALEKMAS